MSTFLKSRSLIPRSQHLMDNALLLDSILLSQLRVCGLTNETRIKMRCQPELGIFEYKCIKYTLKNKRKLSYRTGIARKIKYVYISWTGEKWTVGLGLIPGRTLTFKKSDHLHFCIFCMNSQRYLRNIFSSSWEICSPVTFLVFFISVLESWVPADWWYI